MKRIFISYRRNDSALFTARLIDRLNAYYGADSVFFDIDSIPSAVDFREVVKSHITKCGIFLAVIGKQWAGRRQEGRRIDDPNDYVRIEVEQALAQSKPVVPVYCDEAEQLTAAELPPSLGRLAYLNSCPVSGGRDFNHHVYRLRREINRILYASRPSLLFNIGLRFLKRNVILLSVIAVLCLLVLVLRDWLGRRLLSPAGLHTAAENADPNAFFKGEGGRYQIVRGLPDRAALILETDLVHSMRQTNQSFDIFAVSAAAFASNPEVLKDALQRGVNLRIIILDHSAPAAAHFYAHSEGTPARLWSLEAGKISSKQAASEFRKLAEEVKENPERFKGRIELRWWQGVFHNSFWIRDGHDPANALGHMEIIFYGDVSLNPSLRFGKLSPKMVDGLQQQFEHIWGKSKVQRSDGS